MKRYLFLVLALGLGAQGIFGCGDDTDGGSATDDTNDNNACTMQRTDVGTGEVGDPCWQIEDCKSGKCSIYQSIPDPGDGECAEANAINTLTIQAVVRDIETGQTMENVNVDFGAALSFSANPEGATPVASATSDANGRIDMDIDTKACTDDSIKIGVVARVKQDGYYLSMGGLVAPEVDPDLAIYPSSVRNHDIMVVPAALLASWSEMLAGDTEVAPYLPLGDKGGCVVLTRKISDGSGIAGAKLRSNTNPTGSTAIIRYLNEDKNGFNTVGMGTHGFALVFKPGLGEKFDAVDADGNIISIRPGTMGSTSNAIYTNTLHVK